MFAAIVLRRSCAVSPVSYTHLDPAWALTRPILWLALVGLLVLLVVRTAHKDRKEYQRFKRYRLTARRQEMCRKWFRDSVLGIGLVSLCLLYTSRGV